MTGGNEGSGGMQHSAAEINAEINAPAAAGERGLQPRPVVHGCTDNGF